MKSLWYVEGAFRIHPRIRVSRQGIGVWPWWHYTYFQWDWPKPVLWLIGLPRSVTGWRNLIIAKRAMRRYRSPADLPYIHGWAERRKVLAGRRKSLTEKDLDNA